MRNMRTKHFYYFQGLRVLKCHWTKHSNHVNYRSKWPLQKTFSSLIPPPAWISRVFDPPFRENFQNPIRWGGADFFWNNPFLIMYLFASMSMPQIDWYFNICVGNNLWRFPHSLTLMTTGIQLTHPQFSQGSIKNINARSVSEHTGS